MREALPFFYFDFLTCHSIEMISNYNPEKLSGVVQVKYYIYRFLDKDFQVIYVGRTKDINKRMYTHFNKGHLPKECYQAVERVDYLTLNTNTDMKIKELYYISKYRPLYNIRDNEDCSINIDELQDHWVVYDHKNEVIKYAEDHEQIIKLEKELLKANQKVNELEKELAITQNKLISQAGRQLQVDYTYSLETAVNILKVKKNCTFVNYVEGEHWLTMYKDEGTQEIICKAHHTKSKGYGQPEMVVYSSHKQREYKCLDSSLNIHLQLIIAGCNNWIEVNI